MKNAIAWVTLWGTALGGSHAASAVHTHEPQYKHENPRIEAPQGATKPGDPAPWTSLEALDSEARFHFVVVTDRTGRARAGVWEDAMAKINLMQPAFIVSVGDLIQGGTKDLPQIHAEWDEMEDLIAVLDAPFFYTPGNHDYSNPVMADVWREKFGPDHYSFKYKDVLFIVLNSNVMGDDTPREEWIGRNEGQVAWLEQTLTDNQDVRWTYLFMHQPFWRQFWWRTIEDDEWSGRAGHGQDDWARIATLLENRDYTFFAGHTHSYEYEADEDRPHTHERISLATTGGGITIKEGEDERRDAPLLGPQYAEFDHFVWVTMTENGPVIANLLLEGILPKDFDHFFKKPPLNAVEGASSR